jgi:hypothetical protein
MADLTSSRALLMTETARTGRLKKFKDKSPSGEEVYKRFKSDLEKPLRALRVSRIMEPNLATIE